MIITTLKKRSEFVRVAKVRNMIRQPNVWIQCFRDNTRVEMQCGVGFTASKKVGNAVFRNRAKRRLREIVRKHMPAILEKHPTFKGDFVIIGVPTTVTCPFDVLSDELIRAVHTCLKRVELKQKPPTKTPEE